MAFMDLYQKGSEHLLEKLQEYNLTRSIINKELVGLFNTETLRDMNDILKKYQVYFEGADFNPDSNGGDYTPANWHSKQIKMLIDTEARFLFSESPDITLKDTESTAADNSRVEPNQRLVQKVLEKNHFNSKLVRAAKDCLIGKRVALVTNFNEDTGIDVSFVPSLEFVYETNPSDTDELTKFIQFYSTVVSDDKKQQRVYKKKWYMEDGYCRVVEELYDGNATLIETITPDQATKFTYIPVAIVINDGLTGDPFGVSDVDCCEDDESWFSKLSSKDMDSLRKASDQVAYAIDADPKTTKGLSRAPGSFWDIQTDPAQDGKTAQIGTLDNPMGYAPALATTLQRLKSHMHSQLAVPDTSNEALQGLITSGKTMQAVYWGLSVRCNEKMLDWIPAFQVTIESILTGAQLYPEIAKQYIDEPIVKGYTITIENSYPILQDVTEEKASDILEVNAKVKSRKSYMKKWYGMTDEDVDAELKQIQFEASLLEQENYASENIEKIEDVEEE